MKVFLSDRSTCDKQNQEHLKVKTFKATLIGETGFEC
jgi:hypothetical protein